MKPMHKIFIFCFVSSMILSACQSTPPITIALAPPPAWKAASVELQPIGQPGTVAVPGNINVISNNNGCVRGAGARMGCVNFATDELGTITFKLQGAPGPKSCSPGGAVITKIRLTDTDAGVGPSEEGDFTTSSFPLPVAIRDGGFPELDIADGVVYEAASLDVGLNEITISNINHNDAALGVVDIWYEVTVSRCSDGKIWVVDPRLENEGMN